jgi:hypothetical protein
VAWRRSAGRRTWGVSTDPRPGLKLGDRGDFFIIEGNVEDVDVLLIRSVVVDFGISTKSALKVLAQNDLGR